MFPHADEHANLDKTNIGEHYLFYFGFGPIPDHLLVPGKFITEGEQFSVTAFGDLHMAIRRVLNPNYQEEPVITAESLAGDDNALRLAISQLLNHTAIRTICPEHARLLRDALRLCDQAQETSEIPKHASLLGEALKLHEQAHETSESPHLKE